MNTPSASGSIQRPDRKTVEKNRRVHMKQLCYQLTSLIPPHHFNLSRELLTQQDQLDQATDYIKQLKERIDELKVKKEVLALTSENCNSSRPTSASFTMPMVELRESGSSNIEVLVVSSLENNFRLSNVISVLQEEGADVVSTNMSRVGNRVFHTVHAQAKFSRVGVDTSRILERLQELICLAYLCEHMESTGT
ncbi:Transcription factor bHLH36 like [Heracleum sosnowskyi]|uniref:Transcription factor bHLH36 like n=1 Tax=Heracleum sosnowskyi TaxID=360622 RepID=A0AAD8MEU1_9APIA|nr:Transcription factor bHLH36 like [Heracleum sosnowskyi]